MDLRLRSAALLVLMMFSASFAATLHARQPGHDSSTEETPSSTGQPQVDAKPYDGSSTGQPQVDAKPYDGSSTGQPLPAGSVEANVNTEQPQPVDPQYQFNVNTEQPPVEENRRREDSSNGPPSMTQEEYEPEQQNGLNSSSGQTQLGGYPNDGNYSSMPLIPFGEDDHDGNYSSMPLIPFDEDDYYENYSGYGNYGNWNYSDNSWPTWGGYYDNGNYSGNSWTTWGGYYDDGNYSGNSWTTWGGYYDNWNYSGNTWSTWDGYYDNGNYSGNSWPTWDGYYNNWNYSGNTWPTWDGYYDNGNYSGNTMPWSTSTWRVYYDTTTEPPQQESVELHPCVEKGLSIDAKVTLMLEDNNHNHDSVVDFSDFKFDLINNYDADDDGTINMEEWIDHWQCAYGDTADFALYVWNEYTEGAASITAESVNVDTFIGMPVGEFEKRAKKRYETFDSKTRVEVGESNWILGMHPRK